MDLLNCAVPWAAAGARECPPSLHIRSGLLGASITYTGDWVVECVPPGGVFELALSDVPTVAVRGNRSKSPQGRKSEIKRDRTGTRLDLRGFMFGRE